MTSHHDSNNVPAPPHPSQTTQPAAAPPQRQPQVATPSHPTLPTPFVVHASVMGAVAATLIAPLAGAAAYLLVAGGEISDTYTMMAIIAAVVAVIQALSWTRFVIDADRVRLKGLFGMTRRRIPIQGVGDLVVDGNKLRRRSDNKKIVKLRQTDCSSKDLRTLRAAIPRR